MSATEDIISDWEAMHQEFKRCEESVERRLEPDLIGFNRDKALASIAVSLKRIADALGRLPLPFTGGAAGPPLVISSYATSTPNYGGGGLGGGGGIGGNVIGGADGGAQ